MASIVKPERSSYSALEEHEIRLLRLDFESDSELIGDLFTTSLNQTTEPNLKPLLLEFDALSFAWINHDDEFGKSEILHLNGGDSISITINLARALRRLVKVQRAMKSRKPLWIDQICIDQRNEIEKAQQIAMMGDIYKSADVVIIYLGEPKLEEMHVVEHLYHYDVKRLPYLDASDPELRNRAMMGFHDTMQTEPPALDEKWAGFDDFYAQHSREQENRGNTLNLITIGGRPHDMAEELEARFTNVMSHAGRSRQGQPRAVSNFTAFSYQICAIVMQSRWFERMWTFQEAVLAQQPLVMFGPLVTQLNVYQQLFKHLQRKDLSAGLDVDGHFATLLQAREQRSVSNAGYASLSSLLYMTRMRKATEPRDKVFGVLGLTQMRKYPHVAEKGLYTSPLEQVYAATMASCLEIDGDLAILGATRPHVPDADHDQNDTDLGTRPSWVCDWTRRYAEPISKWSENLITSQPVFKIAGMPSHPSLVLRGLILDRIKSRADDSRGIVFHETLPGSHEYWTQRKTETAQAYSSKGNDIVAELVGTLHQGRNEVNMWDQPKDFPALRRTQEPPFLLTESGGESKVDVMIAAQFGTSFPGNVHHQMLKAHTIVWQYVAQALGTGGYANDVHYDYTRSTRQEIDEIRSWYARADQHQSMESKTCFAAYRAAGICPTWAQQGDLICYFGGSPMLHLIRPIYAGIDPDGEGECTLDSWVLDGKAVSRFCFVGECWFRDYMNLPLAETWDLVRENAAEHTDLARMFVDIELH